MEIRPEAIQSFLLFLIFDSKQNRKRKMESAHLQETLVLIKRLLYDQLSVRAEDLCLKHYLAAIKSSLEFESDVEKLAYHRQRCSLSLIYSGLEKTLTS